MYKHYAIDIADPSSMQETCHMNFVDEYFLNIRTVYQFTYISSVKIIAS